MSSRLRGLQGARKNSTTFASRIHNSCRRCNGRGPNHCKDRGDAEFLHGRGAAITSRNMATEGSFLHVSRQLADATELPDRMDTSWSGSFACHQAGEGLPMCRSTPTSMKVRCNTEAKRPCGLPQLPAQHFALPGVCPAEFVAEGFAAALQVPPLSLPPPSVHASSWPPESSTESSAPAGSHHQSLQGNS